MVVSGRDLDFPLSPEAENYSEVRKTPEPQVDRLLNLNEEAEAPEGSSDPRQSRKRSTPSVSPQIPSPPLDLIGGVAFLGGQKVREEMEGSYDKFDSIGVVGFDGRLGLGQEGEFLQTLSVLGGGGPSEGTLTLNTSDFSSAKVPGSICLVGVLWLWILNFETGFHCSLFLFLSNLYGRIQGPSQLQRLFLKMSWDFWSLSLCHFLIFKI